MTAHDAYPAILQILQSCLLLLLLLFLLLLVAEVSLVFVVVVVVGGGVAQLERRASCRRSAKAVSSASPLSYRPATSLGVGPSRGAVPVHRGQLFIHAIAAFAMSTGTACGPSNSRYWTA